MNYSAFEKAAIEATAGLREVDAEMEQLEVKKQSLEAKREVLDSLVHQLLQVLPTSNPAFAADAGNSTGAVPDAPRPSSFLASAPGGNSFSPRKEEWSSFVQQSTPIPLERK